MYSIDQVAQMARERGISYGAMSGLLGSTGTAYGKEPKPQYFKMRPVVEFDKYGNTIAEYASVKAASQATGHSQGDVLNHCKGSVTYRFTNGRTSFRYANEPMPDLALAEAKNQERHKWVKVEKYNSSGRVVAVYNSLNEAARENGILKNTVCRHCNGATKPFGHGKAYAYRYKEG